MYLFFKFENNFCVGFKTFNTELRMAFRLLDKNKDGRISVSEFQVMLRNFGIQVPDEMVEEFITSKSRSGK